MALIAAILALSAFDDALEDQIASIANEEKLPGIGVAVVTSRGMEWSSYRGVKKFGEEEKVDASTRWHLGSCTKAMTAAVVCRLVDEGKLKLDSPLKGVFSDVKVDKGFEHVTIRHLLSHQSGLIPNLNWGSMRGSLDEVRGEAVSKLLENPPASEVGKYVYSNAGFVVSGAAAERVTGQSIEALLSEEFRKIGIVDFGFGPTPKGGTWPHKDGLAVKTNFDNAPVMTAAGRVNMTLPEWGKWTSAVLNGLRGRDSKLSRSYFKEILSNRLGGDYSMGWIVTSRPWAGGMALTHSGSNTGNFCTVWIAPGKDYAVLVVTNTGGDGVSKAVDRCVGLVIKSKEADGTFH